MRVEFATQSKILTRITKFQPADSLGPDGGGYTLPKIPAEIWFLWQSHTEGDTEGHFVPAIDGPDEPKMSLLAYTDEEAAKIAAAYQNDKFDLNCHPVRVANGLPPMPQAVRHSPYMIGNAKGGGF